MSDSTDIIKRKIANRIGMATRWYKLTNEEQVRRFVFDDPEFQAFIDGLSEDEKMHFIISGLLDEICEDGEYVVARRDLKRQLPRLRRQFGTKLVNLVLKEIAEQEEVQTS
jgi:hypothetical protein